MRTRISWKRGLGAWLTDAVFVALVAVVSSQVSDGNAVHGERNHILVALALLLPYAALRIALPRLWRRQRANAARASTAVIDRRKR